MTKAPTSTEIYQFYGNSLHSVTAIRASTGHRLVTRIEIEMKRCILLSSNLPHVINRSYLIGRRHEGGKLQDNNAHILSIFS